MNAVDIILIILIALILTAAFLTAVRNKRKGGCCGSCYNCNQGCNKKK